MQHSLHGISMVVLCAAPLLGLSALSGCSTRTPDDQGGDGGSGGGGHNAGGASGAEGGSGATGGGDSAGQGGESGSGAQGGGGDGGAGAVGGDGGTAGMGGDGGTAGMGGESGTAGMGGAGGSGPVECPSIAPFEIGMCFTGPSEVVGSGSWPDATVAEGLVVVGELPKDEVSCFTEAVSRYGNPFHDDSNPRSPSATDQRYELKDAEDRRWTLEIGLPTLKGPALNAGDSVALRWVVNGFEYEFEMYGYVAVERDGEVLATAGHKWPPPALAIEHLDVECAIRQGCDGDDEYRAPHHRLRVTVGESSTEMARYTIAEVGDLVVVHQDNESLGECSEFSGGGTIIGAYAARLRR